MMAEPEEAFTVSESGVLVWHSLAGHPLLRQGDVDAPDLIRKAAETYQRGKVKGLPRICSLNSEDACTWYYFHPLVHDSNRRASVLRRLMREAFPAVPAEVLRLLPHAKITFWQGKETLDLRLVAPTSREVREGSTEADVVITLENDALILIEAKYRSGLSTRTKYDSERDQLIRLLDVGSCFARAHGFRHFYVIVLRYGDATGNVEDVVRRYQQKPEAIKAKLGYRTDLTDGDLEQLANNIASVRWPDPLQGYHPAAEPQAPPLPTL